MYLKIGQGLWVARGHSAVTKPIYKPLCVLIEERERYTVGKSHLHPGYGDAAYV